MRKILSLVIVLLIGLGFLTTLPFVNATDSALISNPSAESIDSSGNPINWQRGGWGDIYANMSTSSDSHTGSRSLKVTVDSRVSGDAKWVHSPVSVTAGENYTYTSWYKSNIPTEIDLQYTYSNGSVSYAYLDTIPASAQWNQLGVNFTAPAGVSKVSVLHIVTSAGWLLIDDVDLSKKAEPPVVSDGNLIPNGNLEHSSIGMPLGWNNNSWGVNAATFAYDNQGHNSERSVKVKISSYSSGDAKWYADTVEIDDSKQYQYSDYYKSNVETWVVAAYTDANGNISYYGLDPAPASSGSWRRYDTTLSPPKDAKKLVIYHVIGQVGELSIDDIDLRVKTATTPQVYIPNNSLEMSSGSSPRGWLSNNWGSNTARFQYVDGARTGNKSVKVTVSNYVSGDAKWYFEPTDKLTPGSQYKYSVWYKSNVIPDAAVMYIMRDGSYYYAGLERPKNPISTTSWQQYTSTITVPSDAVATSVFFLLNRNGWLQTDDYSLEDYTPQSFDRPLLSLTFDDGWAGNAQTALPILNQYGLKSTHCYLSEYPSQEKVDSIMAFVNSGHEICSHTVNHPFLTKLDLADLTYQLTESKRYLEAVIKLPVPNFVSPYGDYNQTVINEVKKYYKSHRSVEDGFNSKDNFDRYNIKVQNVLDTTTTQEVKNWIAQAQADGTWLVLVYHKVVNNPGKYDTSIGEFASQMKAISESGIAVRTYNDALDEVLKQL